MASLFFSYSRKDIDFARKLTDAFKGQALDFWIDWESIPPTVEWWEEIKKGIEEADVFLFLLSPDSAKSRVCKQEIEHAAKNGKRLVPIVVRDITASEAPAELQPLNWIFLRESDNFSDGFDKLLTAIRTDYEWVQIHRQLQVKALEWERSGHEKSFFLRGKELQDAETRLARNSSKNPIPTSLQREYVLKSRQASDRQRTITTVIAVAGIISLAVLAAFGFIQAGLATANADHANAASTLASSNESTAQANAEEAQLQASISRARELVAFSSNMQDKNFPVSILLGIEAYRTRDMYETRNMLLNNQETNLQILRFVFNQQKQYLLHSFAISPDGTTAATLGCNNYNCQKGDITFWDAKTFEMIGEPIPVSPAVSSGVGFSPNGKSLVFLGWDSPNSIINLIDVKTRQITKQLSFGAMPIYGLAVNPQQQLMAVNFGDALEAGFYTESDLLSLQSFITLLDLNSLQPVMDPIPVSSLADNLRFGPNGTTLIWSTPSYAKPGAIMVWDIASGRLINQYIEENSIDTLASNPVDQILAVGMGNVIMLLNPLTGKQIAEPLFVDGNNFGPIAFSLDGKMLATADTNSLFLWDLDTFNRLDKSFAIPWRILGMDFLPDNENLLVKYADGFENHAILIDLSTKEDIGQKILTQSSVANSITFSPDGKAIALGDDNGSIRLWDTHIGNFIGQVLNGHVGAVNSVAFNPSGTVLATGGDDEKVILWNLSTYSPIGEPLSGQTGRIVQVAFSPDGKIIASESQENTIYLWDMATGKEISHIDMEPNSQFESVNPLTFSPDGKSLATFMGDTILLWDLTQQPITEHRFPEIYSMISGIAFSQDGKVLSSIDTSGNVILWNVFSFKPINTDIPEQDIWGGGGSVGTTFSPDGKWIASYVGDSLTLWDRVSLRALGKPVEIQASSIAFSPDSLSLIYSDLDGSLFLLSLDPQKWITDACTRAGRNFSPTEWKQYFPDEEYRKTCEQWQAGE